MPELHELSATSLAELIRGREVSSRAVVEAHLERIAAVEPHIGAFTLVLSETARAAADTADRAEPRGRLHGVPFTVKSNLDCLGSPTTHGVPACRDALPYADAPAVARLKAAGAILLGRTNLSEMGLRLCTVNPLHGRTLNPYDRRLTLGGSSGGDAAAVATGMTPLGIGTDIGGSLRVPAHCGGVATLKPTTGRIALGSSLEPRDHGAAGQAMLALGPLARCVADLRLCLQVLAGRDAGDPRSVDVPLLGPEPPLRRAALVTRLPGAPLDPASLAAIARAGESLEAAGWIVEQAEPPELGRVSEVFTKLLATDLVVIVEQIRPVISQALAAHVERLCRRARLEEASNLRLHAERSRLMRAWSLFFADYPIVIGPTWGRPLWPVDADLDPAHGIALLEETVRFITPGNALGLPCVTLPMGLAGGLPASVQIYADLWREDLCLCAAELIEADAGAARVVEPMR